MSIASEEMYNPLIEGWPTAAAVICEASDIYTGEPITIVASTVVAVEHNGQAVSLQLIVA